MARTAPVLSIPLIHVRKAASTKINGVCGLPPGCPPARVASLLTDTVVPSDSHHSAAKAPCWQETFACSGTPRPVHRGRPLTEPTASSPSGRLAQISRRCPATLAYRRWSQSVQSNQPYTVTCVSLPSARPVRRGPSSPAPRASRQTGRRARSRRHSTVTSVSRPNRHLARLTRSLMGKTASYGIDPPVSRVSRSMGSNVSLQLLQRVPRALALMELTV